MAICNTGINELLATLDTDVAHAEKRAQEYRYENREQDAQWWDGRRNGLLQACIKLRGAIAR